MKHRMHDSTTMAQAVGMVGKLRAKLPIGAPMPGVFTPKTSSSSAAPEEPQEVLEGHCLSCRTKRPFIVEGEDKMPNGAIRKYGTSGHPECGHKISHLVSGKAAA